MRGLTANRFERRCCIRLNNVENRTADFVKVAGTHIDAMLLRWRTTVEGLVVIRQEFLSRWGPTVVEVAKVKGPG